MQRKCGELVPIGDALADLAGPGLNYTTAPGLLILHPSIPAIAPLEQRQLSLMK